MRRVVPKQMPQQWFCMQSCRQVHGPPFETHALAACRQAAAGSQARGRTSRDQTHSSRYHARSLCCNHDDASTPCEPRAEPSREQQLLCACHVFFSTTTRVIIVIIVASFFSHRAADGSQRGQRRWNDGGPAGSVRLGVAAAAERRCFRLRNSYRSLQHR